MKQNVRKTNTMNTTYNRLMKNSEFRGKFEKEYESLSLSETLIGLMESEKVSVRELSKRAKVSSTVIQEIRSSKQENPTLLVLSRLFHTLGAELVIKKEKKTLASV